MAQNDVLQLTAYMTVGQAPCSFTVGYKQTSPTIPGDDDVTSILATEFGAKIAGLVNALATQSRFESFSAVVLDGVPNPRGLVVAIDAPGTVSGQALPANKAALITHKQSTAGVRSNGKTFLPGLSEGSTDGATITAAGVLAQIQASFDAIRVLSVNPGPGVYDFQQVVIGARPAVGVPHPTYDVDSQSVASILYNQRRRTTDVRGTAPL